MRGIAAFAATLALTVAAPAAAHAAEATCAVDGAIDPVVRAAVETEALGAFDDFVANRGEALHARWTREAGAAFTAEQMLQLRFFLVGLGDIHNKGLRGSHLINVAQADLPRMVDCGPTRAHPQGVRVSMGRFARVAEVEVEADGVNNTVGFTVELVEEDGRWKITYFFVGGSRISGLGGGDIAALASAERRRGHAFSALLLAKAAIGMLDYGPDVTDNAKTALLQDFATFVQPPELAAPAFPLHWTLGGRAEEIRQINVGGLEGKVWVFIQRSSFGEWPTDAVIDNENRGFIEALLKRWPEIGETFGGIVVQAIHPDGHRLYGTVWSARDGFSDRAPEI